MSKETVRTVCAVIGILIALYAVTVQTAALHFIIKYHPR
jgi:type III secretory pathway component EscS